MRTDTAPAIRLQDYRPPDWLVDTVSLDVSLHPTQTKVRATLKLRPNPENPAANALEAPQTCRSVRSDSSIHVRVLRETRP